MKRFFMVLLVTFLVLGVYAVDFPVTIAGVSFGDTIGNVAKAKMKARKAVLQEGKYVYFGETIINEDALVFLREHEGKINEINCYFEISYLESPTDKYNSILEILEKKYGTSIDQKRIFEDPISTKKSYADIAISARMATFSDLWRIGESSIQLSMSGETIVIFYAKSHAFAVADSEADKQSRISTAVQEL